MTSQLSELERATTFDIQSIGQDFLDDPFPTYKLLREHDPVHINPDGTYFLTRYEDVVKSFKSQNMSSDKTEEFKPKFGDGPLYVHHTTSLVFNDDPYHAVVRKLMAEAFTPKKMSELDAVIDDIVNRLLDKVEEKGEFDVVQDYGLALPTEIIADMLGIPEEHRHKMHHYSTLILGALDPIVSSKKLVDGHRAVEEFGMLLEELITKRRLSPFGAEMGEVLVSLIFGEVEGRKLTPVELVQNCIFLLNAGHETTASLVSNGIGTLLEFPDQLERLREEPGLIKTAIEEFLRYQSPLQIGNRKVTQDTEFGVDGKKVVVPSGSFLHTCLGAANRDPEIFDNPESVDISRRPNPQIAFGIGKHICMGNTLGRMEGQKAIGKFVERFPKLRLNGKKKFHGRARFRGLSVLPVSV
ncbi:MAG: cytochrome P450 [Pseudomonadota bacterium]|nr:cytochrome P450 [Pseudomonadota bacterium]